MADPERTAAVFVRRITVGAEAIDANGHVNNVVYVQWMQDLAVEHYTSTSGLEAQGADCTWVAHEHRVRYLAQAREGDTIEARTWVETMRRVRSKRRYLFVRADDRKTLVEGETDWAFVDAKTGLPRPIPDAVVTIFRGLAQETPRA